MDRVDLRVGPRHRRGVARSVLDRQPLDHVVGADYTKLFIVDDDNQNILDKNMLLHSAEFSIILRHLEIFLKIAIIIQLHPCAVT